ncbi:MAG: metallophosphoesterase [Candidatus Eremiobacteraeota bacterium]|nr:metallophosphoesterase [Candidatus Eremiobacteraeota bacterium]
MIIIIIAVIITLIIIGLVVFVYHETNWIEVNHYVVPMGDVEIKKPIEIVHISDLHMSPWSLPSTFRKTADFINSLQPNYIVMTGDFVTHFKELIPGCAKAISWLKPKVSMLGVLGNHDYWIDAGYICRSLEEVGVELLLNRCSPSKNGSNLTFLGVDDPYTGHDDLKSTSREIPGSHMSVLLSHSPDIIEDAADLGINLVLVGHTHGGQVRLPLLGAIYIPSKHGKRFDKGWFNIKNTKMYVNRGLGGIYPSIRFLCRKEIAIHKLVSGEGKPYLEEKKLIKL